MKKLLALAALFLLFTTANFAQTDITSDLQLNEVQKEQYVQIQMQQKKQIESILSLRSQDPEKFRSKQAEIFSASDKQMKQLLNETQWKVYESIIQQRNKLLNMHPKSK